MNLNESLKALVFPVTSIDNITSMKKLKELPVPFWLLLLAKNVKIIQREVLTWLLVKQKNLN